MAQCEHGWHDTVDCDVCMRLRYAPEAADRIAELEAALRDVLADYEAYECDSKTGKWDKPTHDVALLQRARAVLGK